MGKGAGLFVVNDGHLVAYELYGQGSGPAIVFPHTKAGWDRMGYVDLLRDRGRVLIVDPRGYGDSTRSRTAHGYGLDTFCDDILAAADAASIDTFVAWGYSNTAALSSVLASRSSRVVGLVCAGMDPFANLTWVLDDIAARVKAAGEGEYLPSGRFDWRAVDAFYRGLIGWQEPASQTPLHCPAILPYGTADPVIEQSVTKNAARLIAWGFDLHSLPGLDHQSFFESAEAVVKLVDPLLDRVLNPS